MSSPAETNRLETIEALTGAPLDVLVVGGGIVGAGIVRDAAMRGLRAGLIEQYDFASGTSSRSSRLLHGGLRYLAQGRIGLVREASVEKRIVHTIAPHLSAPLAFVFPAYRCAPWADWALWKLRIGVSLYDLLCGGHNLGSSGWLDAAALYRNVPGIRTRGLTGGVRYFDALTHDARLVIDTLRSATKAGARLLNYCRLEAARRAVAGWRCSLADRLAGRSYEVHARAVVNATGPWAEQLEHSCVRLRLTKGVHLVIDREQLPVADAVVMTEGSRILFAIPWGCRVILGTTDTDYDGPPEAVRTKPEDIRYVLGVTNEAFPEARISERHVISTWAGLRPLIADPQGRPSEISRAHEIRMPCPGWWDVAGGKLTTYRLMAEQTVDRIEVYLGRRPSACTTAGIALLNPREVEGVSGILPPEASQSVVEHYCRDEWAVHLDDVMVRRAGWHFYCADAGRMAGPVADWMAAALGWAPERLQQELRSYWVACGPLGAGAARTRGSSAGGARSAVPDVPGRLSAETRSRTERSSP